MSLSRRRVLFLFSFLAAWGVIVVGRLVQVQLVRHGEYVSKAQRQQERTIALSPVRGSILDARGRVLAESVSAESIYADPQAISNIEHTARALASIPALNMSVDTLEQKLAAGGGFVWIARQVSLEATSAIRKLRLPGIYYLDEHRRSYPRGELAANVIGYVGLDGEGLAGVEHSFDSHVRGRAGRVTLLRDARKGMYLVGGEGANRAVDGSDVVLTIDSVVQFIAERALTDAVTRYHAAGGSVVVMNPADGSILAMASAPTFDPNRFRDSPPASWRNHSVQDLYEPGSTFKVITASAGLEEGVVTPSQMLDCGNGVITVGNVDIHEHGHNQYGLITFEDVMVHSSNVGAIRVGLALGQETFYRYIRRFGFGERTGIPLPGEASGILRRTSRWSAVSNASMSMGQEISVTPLQIVAAFATVANGGLRVTPRIVDRLVDSNNNTVARVPAPPPVRVISEKTAAVLNEILKAVVARGTGAPAALADHVVAGKTGTAQKAGRGGYSLDKVVASFGGYVPADRPRLAILVVIDEPRGAQYGGTVAAPAFREIAESTLRYLGVAPSVPSRTIGVGAPLLATFSQHPEGTAERSATMGGREGVPDVRGLDARAAVARATAAGFVVRATGSGVVQSQNPEPGGGPASTGVIVLRLTEGAR
ncbi:MAG: penicillin-binding transpeptidase domain-containing protein [Thermoanaerobaculia bacterium]